MLHRIVVLVSVSAALLSVRSGARASNPITNYRSGISVIPDGVDEVDFAFECFYHDPAVDDRGVIYIKDTTVLRLEHNERNMRQECPTPYYVYDIGEDGEDGVPDSGDEGIIRFRVDRDLMTPAPLWSAIAGDSFPAYTAPFAFGELDYGPEHPEIPVVGTVGGIGTDILERENYFHAGELDEFGDEWHSMDFADDDEWLYDHWGGGCGAGNEKYASDGKQVLFVVNPRTPLIYFTASSDGAQWYTTPPRAWGVPRVFGQTTYVTDGVSIHLINIMGQPVYCRFGTDAFTPCEEPIGTDSLADGVHVLEYYYDESFPKRRTIVKNPDFPSAGEEHGNLLWRDAAELEAVKARLQTGADHGYRQWYETIKSEDFFNGHDIPLGQGLRVGAGFAFANAFIALVEGFDHARDGDPYSYAQYAKRMLLDNVRVLDPLWFGDLPGAPNPSSEILDRGYYDVNEIYSNVFAYDVLIADYRATQHPDGITPIEDHKIRDMLARFCMESLMQMGGYGSGYIYMNDAEGMWGTARNLGALVVAAAMPTYDTPYYGTSGFDGTSASHPYTPYPDHPVTWHKAFFTETDTLYGYPNRSHSYDQTEVSGIYEGPLITEEPVDRGDRVCPAGSFANRIGYFSNHVMGHCFYITATVMKIRFDHTYASWEAAFNQANRGTLYGLQGTGTDLDPMLAPQILLVNEHFPELAAGAEANLSHGTDYEDEFHVWSNFTSNGVYSLILYHDDWRNHVPDGGVDTGGDASKGCSCRSPGKDEVAVAGGACPLFLLLLLCAVLTRKIGCKRSRKSNRAMGRAGGPA